MHELVYMFQEGGVWAYAILATQLAGGTATLLWFGLAVFRKYVPGVMWHGPAALMAVLAAAGSAFGLAMANDAIAFADPSQQGSMMAMGISQTMTLDVMARVGIWVCASGTALAAALAHLIAQRGDEGETTWTPAVVSVGLAGLGTLTGGIWAIYRMVESHSGIFLLLPVLAGVCAMALIGAVGLRSPGPAHAHLRAAGTSLTVWAASVMAVMSVGKLVSVLGERNAFAAVAVAAADQRSELLTLGLEWARADGLPSTLITLGVVLAGLPLLARAAKAVEGRMWVGLEIALVIVLLLTTGLGLAVCGVMRGEMIGMVIAG